jgi:hypothetical protein
MMKTKMAIAVLGLATLASVAPAQGTQQLPPTVAPDSSYDNTVTVQNDRKVPVTVYMDYGPFDRRLGTVPGLRTATLPLPKWAVEGRDRIQLFVHPEGEVDDLATQEFSLKPPARLGMIVPARGNMPSTMQTDGMTVEIPPEELADATLTVENPRSTAVTIFAEQGPFEVRLGQVPADSSATLQFPKSVVLPNSSIQIVVHPEGGLDLASEMLEVWPGRHLGLRVPLR